MFSKLFETKLLHQFEMIGYLGMPLHHYQKHTDDTERAPKLKDARFNIRIYKRDNTTIQDSQSIIIIIKYNENSHERER